ncbi:hypothetical protein CRUP_007465, partial [Coryphaenoides rupestris]
MSDAILVYFRFTRVQDAAAARRAIGGKETAHEVWKYNGALDRWIRTEPMATGRWRHKMAVHGGKLYVLGGFDGIQRLASASTLASLWIPSKPPRTYSFPPWTAILCLHRPVAMGS